MNSKKTKILLIAAVVALGAVFVIGSVVLVLVQFRIEKQEMSYFAPYVTEAEAFVLASEEIAEELGTEPVPKHTSTVYRYTTDEYVDFVFYRRIPADQAEFDANVDYIHIEFAVGGRKTCIVKFVKDENGKLTLTEWEWKE